VQLQDLEEVECRLIVRDGARPEIVLQPELATAHAVFQELWRNIRVGLGEAGDIGDFDASDFTLALFPPQHWHIRPPLAYADALAVLHQRAGREQRTPEALPRLIAFLTVAAAYRLGLQNGLALAFGEVVAYLLTGNPASIGSDFERGLAHRIFWGNTSPTHKDGLPLDEHVWQGAQPGLHRVLDQFQIWQDAPESYARARETWYIALTVEIGSILISPSRH
jgi:hypothetical protein